MTKIYKLLISSKNKLKETQRLDFEKILLGDISLINHNLLVSEDNPDWEIIVLPSVVKSMFNRFLENKINADDLQRWAEFLCFRDEYVCKDQINEISADYYVDMWHTVQMASTPEIDGKITPETVRRYLNMLNKYSD